MCLIEARKARASVRTNCSSCNTGRQPERAAQLSHGLTRRYSPSGIVGEILGLCLQAGPAVAKVPTLTREPSERTARLGSPRKGHVDYGVTCDAPLRCVGI